jgi:glycogen synthase
MWADGCIELLQERTQAPHAWENRRRAGLIEVERFSWTANARQTLQTYRNVLDRAEWKAQREPETNETRLYRSRL